MELDYSIKPGLLQRWKPALQNWRLMAFIGFFCLLFGCFGYTIVNEVLSQGVHQHGDYAEVDLKSMGQFPFDDQAGLLTDVPKVYRELDGKRVALKGMMWEVQSAGPTTNRFQLVYNIQKCCFGGPPKVQERVYVYVPKSTGVQFYDQLVNVVGKLHVRLMRNENGQVISVYDMELENLKPV